MLESTRMLYLVKEELRPAFECDRHFALLCLAEVAEGILLYRVGEYSPRDRHAELQEPSPVLNFFNLVSLDWIEDVVCELSL